MWAAVLGRIGAEASVPTTFPKQQPGSRASARVIWSARRSASSSGDGPAIERGFILNSGRLHPTNRLASDGFRNSARDAGLNRMRPIAMTTIAAILTLMPLALP